MSRLRLRFPVFYRFATLIALLAMLTPMGIMLVHHPEAAQKFVHICSLSPEKWLAQKTGKDTPQKLPSCPICVGMHVLVHALDAPQAPVIAQIDATPALFSSARSVSLKTAATPQARPRAPPAFV